MSAIASLSCHLWLSDIWQPAAPAAGLQRGFLLRL